MLASCSCRGPCYRGHHNVAFHVLAIKLEPSPDGQLRGDTVTARTPHHILKWSEMPLTFTVCSFPERPDQVWRQQSTLFDYFGFGLKEVRRR